VLLVLSYIQDETSRIRAFAYAKANTELCTGVCSYILANYQDFVKRIHPDPMTTMVEQSTGVLLTCLSAMYYSIVFRHKKIASMHFAVEDLDFVDVCLLHAIIKGTQDMATLSMLSSLDETMIQRRIVYLTLANVGLLFKAFDSSEMRTLSSQAGASFLRKWNSKSLDHLNKEQMSGEKLFELYKMDHLAFDPSEYMGTEFVHPRDLSQSGQFTHEKARSQLKCNDRDISSLYLSSFGMIKNPPCIKHSPFTSVRIEGIAKHSMWAVFWASPTFANDKAASSVFVPWASEHYSSSTAYRYRYECLKSVIRMSNHYLYEDDIPIPDHPIQVSSAFLEKGSDMDQNLFFNPLFCFLLLVSTMDKNTRQEVSFKKAIPWHNQENTPSPIVKAKASPNIVSMDSVLRNMVLDPTQFFNVPSLNHLGALKSIPFIYESCYSFAMLCDDQVTIRKKSTFIKEKHAVLTMMKRIQSKQHPNK
jgi:hypothetical protein